MVKRIKFTTEAFEKYLDGLNEKFDTTIAWNTLEGKAEYGTVKSEKGYQSRAAFKAASMAREIGLNEERTSFFVKCLGAAFPAFGKQGIQCVEEYAIIHDISYDKKETMASVIEESLAQSGRFVVEGLRDYLLELFDVSADSGIDEIELAKLFHIQMEMLKILDRSSSEEYEEGERLLDEEIPERIKEIGIVGAKNQLMEELKSAPAPIEVITEEEKEHCFKRMDEFREYSGDECLINYILHARNTF